MARSHGNSTVQLHVEKLESRALLTAVSIAPDLLPNNPDGSSDLPGGGFPGQVSAAAAASLYPVPFASGFMATSRIVDVLIAENGDNLGSASNAPAANTGVGQMTITTGANTPGLGSFATSVCGFSSENGGRS